MQKKISTFQDLANAFNKQQAEKDEADESTMDFHARQGKRLKINPDPFSKYNSAVQSGILKGYKVQQDARDGNETAMKTYDASGRDVVKICRNCIENEILATGAERFEAKNLAFESAALNSLKPQSEDDSFAINRLRTALKNTWSEFGYTKSMSTFNSFVGKNRLDAEDTCRDALNAVLDAYGEKLDQRIRNSAPSATSAKMARLRNEMESEDSARRDKDRDRGAVEAAKRGELD
ncbi:MAG TPA: hypothetical protein VGQ53_08605 [Chitinophagaceae bacterium]|jgi:hypothetical protein|nr:hypothetical protein [Chitinophagaceae bacterium]